MKSTFMKKNTKVAKDKIIKVNNDIAEFIEAVKNKYGDVLTDEEKQSFNNIRTHMFNINDILKRA